MLNLLCYLDIMGRYFSVVPDNLDYFQTFAYSFSFLSFCTKEMWVTWLRKEIYTTISVFMGIFFSGSTAQRGLWPPRITWFRDNTQRRTTACRTLLSEWSARRRDLYLTTHNTHYRQTSMPPAVDRAATETGRN
jgi:hypothetical protein